MPSHLFQSFMRRRGIYCNLRRINSVYLFRSSLCRDHKPHIFHTNTGYCPKFIKQYFMQNLHLFYVIFISIAFAWMLQRRRTSSWLKSTDGLKKICMRGSECKELFSPSRASAKCPQVRHVTPICSSFGSSVANTIRVSGRWWYHNLLT